MAAPSLRVFSASIWILIPICIWYKSPVELWHLIVTAPSKPPQSLCASTVSRDVSIPTVIGIVPFLSALKAEYII